MSSFEFILVALAIVVGFGISTILTTWGELLRTRREAPVFPLQIVASVYVLGLSLRYLWTLWIFRSIDWTYGHFLIVAIPALVLALASHLINLEADYESSPEQAYLRIHRPLGLLLVLVPAAGALQALLNYPYSDAPGGTFLLLVWPVAVGAFLWIGASRNLRHHWVAWGVLWLLQISVSVHVLGRLQGPAA
jgi:hypothetical protein